MRSVNERTLVFLSSLRDCHCSHRVYTCAQKASAKSAVWALNISGIRQNSYPQPAARASKLNAEQALPITNHVFPTRSVLPAPMLSSTLALCRRCSCPPISSVYNMLQEISRILVLSASWYRMVVYICVCPTSCSHDASA